MSDSDGDKEDTGPKMSEQELASEIEQKCLEAFMKFDKTGTGQVSSGQVQGVLEMMNIKITENELFKMITEIDPENTGLIMYSEFKPKIVDREIQRLMGSDEVELLDAFVAMGGKPDGEGSIDARKLIKTIKNDFAMTIDIEKLIAEIDEDGSGEIEFEEFKALLQSD